MLRNLIFTWVEMSGLPQREVEQMEQDEITLNILLTNARSALQIERNKKPEDKRPEELNNPELMAKRIEETKERLRQANEAKYGKR